MNYLSIHQLAKAVPYAVNMALTAAATWGITKSIVDHSAIQTEQTVIPGLASQLAQTGAPMAELLNKFCDKLSWPDVACDTSLDTFANWVALNLSQINATVDAAGQDVMTSQFDNTGPSVSLMIFTASVCVSTLILVIRKDTIDEMEQAISNRWTQLTHLLTAVSTCIATSGATLRLSNPGVAETIRNAAANVTLHLGNQTGAPLPILLKQVCQKSQGTFVTCNLTKAEWVNSILRNESAIRKVVNDTAQTLVDQLPDTKVALGLWASGTITLVMLGGGYWMLCRMRENPHPGNLQNDRIIVNEDNSHSD